MLPLFGQFISKHKLLSQHKGLTILFIIGVVTLVVFALLVIVISFVVEFARGISGGRKANSSSYISVALLTGLVGYLVGRRNPNPTSVPSFSSRPLSAAKIPAVDGDQRRHPMYA
jgi:hypothetical protein